MKLLIRSNEVLMNELLFQPIADELIIERISNLSELSLYKDAAAIIDLLFENTEEEKKLLAQFLPKPVIVNSVCDTLQEIDQPFIRINGWPTLLKRKITEAACLSSTNRQTVETIFAALGRKTEWVNDQPGFISARIISMIVNEAFFSISESVSNKEEIDIAMKLGANYLYGPFEWGEKIGMNNICQLLTKLSKNEARYLPCDFLTKSVFPN